MKKLKYKIFLTNHELDTLNFRKIYEEGINYSKKRELMRKHFPSKEYEFFLLGKCGTGFYLSPHIPNFFREGIIVFKKTDIRKFFGVKNITIKVWYKLCEEADIIVKKLKVKGKL